MRIGSDGNLTSYLSLTQEVTVLSTCGPPPKTIFPTREVTLEIPSPGTEEALLLSIV